MPLRDIRHQFVLPAPITEVWNAVATSEGLAAWLMPNDFDALVGKKFTFKMPPQQDWSGITYCEVLELSPPHRISFTWTSDPASDLNPTIVSFELVEVSGGTEFTLEHSGWGKLPEVMQPVRDMLDEGWGRHTRDRIKSYLGI